MGTGKLRLSPFIRHSGNFSFLGFKNNYIFILGKCNKWRRGKGEIDDLGKMVD